MENELKELLNKRILTNDDKKLIEDLSNELNVKFIKRSSCQNCYQDQILLLLKALTVQKIENGEITNDYVLRPDIDVIYNDLTSKTDRNIRINNSTLTDELAEKLLNMGLRHWFLKVKEDLKFEQTPKKTQTVKKSKRSNQEIKDNQVVEETGSQSVDEVPEAKEYPVQDE